MHKRVLKSSSLQLAFLVLALLFLGCKDKGKNEVTAELSAPSTTPKAKSESWPKADSYVNGIPIYKKFDGLEPLFKFENDTTYVINFWATWCRPCIKELPYFEEFNSRHKNEKVKVVLVSLDFPKQVETNLVPFVKKKALKSKVVVLLDGQYNDWIDKVSPDWSGAIPATYIYKGSQNRLVGEPFENLEHLNEIVKPFL